MPAALDALPDNTPLFPRLSSTKYTVGYFGASNSLHQWHNLALGALRRGLIGGTMATNSNFVPTPISDEKELVTVFDTNDETEALVVQGLLESNGIESLLTNLDAPQDVFPGVGGVVLRVRQSEAEEAQSVIESFRNDQPAEEESSEAEIP